jgi:thiol-disulfide isomerase/thioredoxin
MSRIGIVILLSLILNNGIVYAQLKIGDKVRAEEIERLLSGKSLTVKPGNYRGKKIIFDFWSIYCLSCMKSFASLDSLQLKYRNDVQIVLVNFDSRESTEKVFSKFKTIHRPRYIPLVSANGFFRSNFKRDKFPYALWLSEDGTIKYFTEAYNSSKKNIEAFLLDKALDVDTITLQRDKLSSLVAIPNDEWESRFLFYSYITRWVKGIDIGYRNVQPINNGKSVRLCINAASITELCKLAFEERGKHNFNLPYTIELNVADSARYIAPADMSSYDQWKKNNAYNYDLVIPVENKDKAYERMQSDIQNYFDIEVKIEKRLRTCLIVQKTGPLLMPDITNLNQDSFFYYKAVPNIFFAKMISEWDEFFPVLDETGEKINAVIPYSITTRFDLNRLNQSLKLSNLKLVQGMREVEVLIINEKRIANRYSL